MFQRLRRLLRRLPLQYDGSGFSVRVQSIGRELARITYVRDGRPLDLDADCYGGVRASIVLKVPKELAAGRVQQVVSDLAEGFAKLGYGYEIYRAGEPQAVPEEERRQALADLRTMGMEATVEGNTVKTAKLPGFRPPSKEEAAGYGIRMMELVRTASGKRVPVEVLASAKPPAD